MTALIWRLWSPLGDARASLANSASWRRRWSCPGRWCRSAGSGLSEAGWAAW